MPLEKVFQQGELHAELLVCYCVFMHISMCTLVIQNCPPNLHFKLNGVCCLTVMSWSRVSCHAALSAFYSSPGQAVQFSSLVSLLVPFGFKYTFSRLKVPLPFSFIHRHKWVRYFCSQSTNFRYRIMQSVMWVVRKSSLHSRPCKYVLFPTRCPLVYRWWKAWPAFCAYCPFLPCSNVSLFPT